MYVIILINYFTRRVITPLYVGVSVPQHHNRHSVRHNNVSLRVIYGFDKSSFRFTHVVNVG